MPLIGVSEIDTNIDCWRHGEAVGRVRIPYRLRGHGRILTWSIAAMFAASGWIAAATSQDSTTAEREGQPSQDSLLVLPIGPKPVVVRCAFHLEDIDAIDDELETFEFSGVLSLVWQDPRQAFEPTAAHLTDKVYQGDYQFNEIAPAWFPQVDLANSNGASETSAVTLRIAPDGTCTLTQAIHGSAEGKLNLRTYPFDRQSLQLAFQVFGFDSHEVMLQPNSDAVNSTSALTIRLPQWTVTQIASSARNCSLVTAQGNQVVSRFVVEVDVQRRSLFMLRLVVIPLGLIVVLSWSVFWMDRSSLGDRINVSFIGILTAVAYQIVVGGILPHISYITWMNAFLNVSFWIMCATVVINILVGEVDKRGRLELGDRIDRHCRWLFPLAYVARLMACWLFVYRLN